MMKTLFYAVISTAMATALISCSKKKELIGTYRHVESYRFTQAGNKAPYMEPGFETCAFGDTAAIFTKETVTYYLWADYKFALKYQMDDNVISLYDNEGAVVKTVEVMHLDETRLKVNYEETGTVSIYQKL